MDILNKFKKRIISEDKEEVTDSEKKYLKSIKGRYYTPINSKLHFFNALKKLIELAEINKEKDIDDVIKGRALDNFIEYTYNNKTSSIIMDMCIEDIAVFLHRDVARSTANFALKGKSFYASVKVKPVKEKLVLDKIYRTKDYSKFKFSKVNRLIDTSQVKKLVKTIKLEGQLEPIVVDSSFTVLNGQHRLTACIELGIEVIYLLSKKKTSQRMILASNNVSKSWTLEDYLHSNVAAGKKDYIVVKKYKEDYVVSLPITLSVLKIKSSEFKSGNLVLDVTDAMKKDFKLIEEFSGEHQAFGNKRFLTEVLKYLRHEGFDKEKFKRQIRQYNSWISNNYTNIDGIRADIRRLMTFKTKEAGRKKFNLVDFDVMNE
ncbi:MAG: ParB-like nuclease domain-containing protein [Chlamydiia bacterium]|nr:ParB-like nuclease domain-containing protein [Chlamydiia bacterium]